MSIESIVVQDSPDEDDDSVDLTCPICMCEMGENEYIYNLTCHHIFHIDCLEQWYMRRNTCPVCKQNIDFIVTLEDEYTFNREAYERSLRESASVQERKLSMEMKQFWSVCCRIKGPKLVFYTSGFVFELLSFFDFTHYGEWVQLKMLLRNVWLAKGEHSLEVVLV